MTLRWRVACLLASAGLLCGCARTGPDLDADSAADTAEYYGTLEPFASEAVYFVVTDRFVDGDPGNNHRQQGGASLGTFDRPVRHADGGAGNIGYLGGDFRGLLDNAGYIADMGFTAVWLTPIVDNPDEAFTGGYSLDESAFADKGKTGYHGYWGVNFFQVDEHLPSAGLSFADLTRELHASYDIKTVLDIVCNHGSPSFTMPVDQPKFGELYAQDGSLVADHQNLEPARLDYANPLHRYYHREPDITQLSNMNDTNPDVLEYFVSAYLQWIDQGADAFRIDTIKHMPHAYWKQFSDRIRAVHPGFFMFGESFDYDAARIAEHTYPENGGIRVLDFPGKASMNDVFASVDSNYSELLDYLHLTDGLYQNPYEQMIFYDNHDMPRMDATASGFIDAHNWLFTSRGIPVVYYGSEVGFRSGAGEHRGNRDYFGQQNIDAAPSHPIHAALKRIAQLRKKSPALQRGLQANLDFTGDKAAFLRVFQHRDVAQTALVLLNKSDSEAGFTVDRWLSAGTWTDAFSGTPVQPAGGTLETTVPAHGVRVLVFDGVNNNAELERELNRLQSLSLRTARPAH